MSRAACPDCRTRRPCDVHRCTGKAKSTQERCKLFAIAGGNVCGRYHGGRAPQTVTKAHEGLALEQARLLVAGERKLGRILPIDEADAMLELVHEAHANVVVLRQLIDQLDAGHIDTGILDEDGERRIVGLGSTLAIHAGSAAKSNEAMRHIWVTMYDEERDRLMNYCVAARRCGAKDRQIEIAQNVAQQLATALQGAANALLAFVVALVGDRVSRIELETAWRKQWPTIARAQIAAVRTHDDPP